MNTYKSCKQNIHCMSDFYFKNKQGNKFKNKIIKMLFTCSYHLVPKIFITYQNRNILLKVQSHKTI